MVYQSRPTSVLQAVRYFAGLSAGDRAKNQVIDVAGRKETERANINALSAFMSNEMSKSTYEKFNEIVAKIGSGLLGVALDQEKLYPNKTQLQMAEHVLLQYDKFKDKKVSRILYL